MYLVSRLAAMWSDLASLKRVKDYALRGPFSLRSLTLYLRDSVSVSSRCSVGESGATQQSSTIIAIIIT